MPLALWPTLYDAFMNCRIVQWLAAASLFACMCNCVGQKTNIRHLSAQGAIGPYSGSVLADSLCFVSGKIAPDAAAGGGFAAEVAAAIEAVRSELARSGLGLDDVLSVTAYLASMDDFGEFNRVYAELFQPPYPARTTVAVSALPAGRRVELTAVARAKR